MASFIQVLILEEMEKLKMASLIRISILLIFFTACGDSGRATQSELPTPVVTYTPGEIMSDIDGYIQYYVGNTPIIITVPHDGDSIPTTIPARTGDVTKAENTLGIAEYFYNSFTSNGANGLYPHIIINNINRSRLDPDLNIEAGAQSNYASGYYNRYHNYIQTAIDSANTNFGIGVLVNLSAHKNDDNGYVELGYLLSKDDLNSSDSYLNNLSSQSSLNAISTLSDAELSETIRGFDSIGKKMMELNCCKPVYYSFDVTPSTSFPSPQSEDYNAGGYTVSRYADIGSSNISTIEFSTPYTGHRDSPYGYIALGTMLVESLQYFYELSTGMSLGIN